VGKHTRLRTGARYEILTGKLPHSHRVWTNASYEGGGIHTAFKDLEGDTIATRFLQAMGVNTAIFGKYINGYPGYVKNPDGSLNATRAVPPPGWERFVVILVQDADSSTPREWLVNRHAEEWRPQWPRTDTALIRSELIAWVTAPEQLSAPWLALMATQSPHDPYSASPSMHTISMWCSSPTGEVTTKPTCRTSPKNSGLSRTSRTPGAWGMASLGTVAPTKLSSKRCRMRYARPRPLRRPDGSIIPLTRSRCRTYEHRCQNASST
jgi:hypothetical protein